MDIREIKALVKLIENSEIDEFELEEDNKKIRISKNLPGNKSAELPQTYMFPPSGFAAPAPMAAPLPGSEKSENTGDDSAKKYSGNAVEVKSPMVGTFYRAPAPDAPLYVEIGDEVKIGQTLCIIEAMKLMNEIECEVNGKVVDILVENAEPVEFGKVLFIIDKH